MYHEDPGEKLTGHMFLFENTDSFSIVNTKQGYYPPFDCVDIDRDSARALRDWLNKILEQ